LSKSEEHRGVLVDVLTLFLSVIMLSIGIIINSGIVSLRFIPKDFLEVLGYNLNVNSFVLYGVLAFTVAGAIGSLSVINFNSVKAKVTLRVSSAAVCAVGVVLAILAIINWNLANNFYVLVFSLALIFMELSLMLLEIYSMLEDIKENWRG